VVCKDIGISVWEDDYAKRTTKESVKKLFENRLKNSHKGCYGSACVIGGCRDYTGSILLSSSALTAFKMGIGYCALAVPESLFSAYVGKVPECLLLTFNDDSENQSDKKVLGFDSIAIGMGMGVSQSTYNLIKYLTENYDKTLIIDADGLNSISKYGLDVFKNSKAKIVITPHVGEFARLSGLDKQEIICNPIKCAVDFAKTHGIIVVLKSATSVITDGQEVYLNTTGSSGLAKAGSGDVLSGVLAGLGARCCDLLNCVVSGAYLFGMAGEIAEREFNAFTVTATDVIKALPKAIDEIRA
jgi:NAD(P)H-hydrate epimerase